MRLKVLCWWKFKFYKPIWITWRKNAVLIFIGNVCIVKNPWLKSTKSFTFLDQKFQLCVRIDHYNLVFYNNCQNKLEFVARVCESSDILIFLKPYFYILDLTIFLAQENLKIKLTVFTATDNLFLIPSGCVR